MAAWKEEDIYTPVGARLILKEEASGGRKAK